MDKFGKPQIYVKYPKTKDAAEITWTKNGSKIHAFINVDNVAYAVEVSGVATPCNTGRGLRLGGRSKNWNKSTGAVLPHTDRDAFFNGKMAPR